MEALKTEKVQGMLQHYLNTTRPSSDNPNSPATDSMDREHYVFEAYYDDLYGRGRLASTSVGDVLCLLASFSELGTCAR